MGDTPRAMPEPASGVAFDRVDSPATDAPATETPALPSGASAPQDDPRIEATRADAGAVPGSGSRQHLRFAFTGKAGDYFRIWIVNLLLTLVTIGLWSPWAKVRKRRFFYGHTWLADANFEYHANPVAILRGRLIAAVAIGVYWVLENLVPRAAPWLLGALLCGAPWIVARSLAFNAANSSHRGIRFRFCGTPRDVALAIWPLALFLVAFVWVSRDTLEAFESPSRYAGQLGLVYLMLLIAYPYAIAQIRRLTIGKSAWGDQPFRTTLRVRSVYGIYLIGIALCGIPLVGAGIVGFFLATVAGMAMGASPAVAFVAMGFFVLAWAGIIIVWTAYNRSRLTNLALNTATLSHMAQLHSAVSARKLARLYAGNVIAIVGTCGLLIPWAVVRITCYRLHCVTMEIEAPHDAVTAAVAQVPSATGEELSEMLGFDLAL
jgi:uncharacterized membrane protein YjgN (DUF898 family)